MGENSEKLAFVPLKEEQPLQNFDTFKAYASLVERQLEDFIRDEGLTVKVITYQGPVSHRFLSIRKF